MADTVLDITDLQLLRGSRTILSGVRLQVSRGEIVARDGQLIEDLDGKGLRDLLLREFTVAA